MKRIYEKWEQYREFHVSPTASPQQVQETRRAFYAGVVFMNEIFFEFMQGSISPEKIHELMTSLESEIMDYVTLVKMGVV